MASTTQQQVKSIMDNVIEILNFTDSRYTLQEFDSIAQNYFGVVIPVSVTSNSAKETVDLVLKLAPTDERYRVSGAVNIMFAKEIYVYSMLLEKYSEFQNNFVSNLRYIIPKYYYIQKDYCKEVIVMQNMCKENFKPFTQQPFLDYDHIRVSLISLAKFHALSFVLKEKEQSFYKEAKNICAPLSEKTNKRFMDILEDRIRKAIQKFSNTKYLNLLKKFQENCINYVEAAAYSVPTLCICHGDIWKENILFKYENDKPSAACIIDYQTARMCSPAFDVLYLIISSTNSELRKEHYKELLNIYYDKFDEVLRNVDMQSSKVYPRETFDNDLRVVGPACFIIANTALWLSNGLQEEGHIRSKIICKTPEEKEIAINKYKNIIAEILDDFDSYGYLPSV